MKTLADVYERYRVDGLSCGHGDKGSTHSYIESYERLLAHYRSGCTFMEIGIAMGLSLEMWREYMPNSKIIGVDKAILFDRAKHEATGTILITADATTPELFEHLDVFGEFPERLDVFGFDVVIDDASHMADDQMDTFKLLRPLMNPGGIYVIEDILALDVERKRFEALHPRLEIIDLRHVKGRFDDVLLVYRF